MAARSIASAYVSFGLVSIPVRLFTANQTSETISFRMLHRKCGSPLKQQYICPRDNEVVEREDIAKGYEYAKDQYVLFSPEELKALEEEPNKQITIGEFVPQAKVDSIYFDKAYYLGPDKGGERAYTLLAQAMQKSGLVGLATYAARGKQYIVLVRPISGGLVMQQLRYADEVRPFSEVPMPEKVAVKDAELKLALQLIEQSVAEDFRPEQFEDEVRKRILGQIQKKVEGQEITVAPSETPQAQVIDLMEALKASLGMAPEEKAAARKVAKASVRKDAKKAEAPPTAKKRAAR